MGACSLPYIQHPALPDLATYDVFLISGRPSKPQAGCKIRRFQCPDRKTLSFSACHARPTCQVLPNYLIDDLFRNFTLFSICLASRTLLQASKTSLLLTFSTCPTVQTGDPIAIYDTLACSFFFFQISLNFIQDPHLVQIVEFVINFAIIIVIATC